MGKVKKCKHFFVKKSIFFIDFSRFFTVKMHLFSTAGSAHKKRAADRSPPHPAVPFPFPEQAYLMLLSYGLPSALGALERLEVKASTIREMM